VSKNIAMTTSTPAPKAATISRIDGWGITPRIFPLELTGTVGVWFTTGTVTVPNQYVVLAPLS
jgi:hypothetical protein